MKFISIVTFLGAVLSATTTNPTVNKSPEGRYVENSYLIKLKSTARTTIDSHLEQVKSLFIERSGIDSIKHVYRNLGNNLYAAKFSSSVLDKVKALPEVEYVEQEGIVSINELQRDAPWGIARMSQRKPMDNYITYRLRNNYTYETTGEGIAVYVVDTGIQVNTTQFEGRAVFGANFAVNSTNNDDEHGHGTQVAGIIGAKQLGVLKKATLVAVKILGPDGQGGQSEFIAGLDWAVKDSRGKVGNVINLSLGGAKQQALDDAVEAAFKKGAIVVVAAGNDNVDACTKSPSSSPNAITVGALDIVDWKASFSNYGSCVDVWAPGQDTPSTYKNKVTSFSGTSAACPHIAGLAGYYKALNPTFTNVQIAQLIKETATKNAVIEPGKGSPNLLGYNNNVKN